MSKRRRNETLEEESEVKKDPICFSCKRSNVELGAKNIPLMVHNRKPLIVFCTDCKKTYPKNAKPLYAPIDEGEEEE